MDAQRITLLALLLAARPAFAEEPTPMREWFALGAGAALPMQSGGSGGLAFAAELGRHWTGEKGEDGFASGLFIQDELRFPDSGALSSLLLQFRVLWDLPIAEPSGGLLLLGPGVAGGVGLDFNGGASGTVVSGLLTPHVDLRWFLGADRVWLLYVRASVPIRLASVTTAELCLIAGTGLRFAVF